MAHRPTRYNQNMHSMAAASLPMVGSPLRMAADALDQLDREDPLDLPAAVLGEEIAGLFTILNRTAAAISRRVGVFDRRRTARRPSPSHRGLAAAGGPAGAQRGLRAGPGRAPARPAAGGGPGAFAAGEVGFGHAQVITRVLEEAPAEVAEEAEPVLVEMAQRVDPHRLGMLTRHLRHTFAPEASLAEANRNHERRRST